MRDDSVYCEGLIDVKVPVDKSFLKDRTVFAFLYEQKGKAPDGKPVTRYCADFRTFAADGRNYVLEQNYHLVNRPYMSKDGLRTSNTAFISKSQYDKLMEIGRPKGYKNSVAVVFQADLFETEDGLFPNIKRATSAVEQCPDEDWYHPRFMSYQMKDWSYRETEHHKAISRVPHFAYDGEIRFDSAIDLWHRLEGRSIADGRGYDNLDIFYGGSGPAPDYNLTRDDWNAVKASSEDFKSKHGFTHDFSGVSSMTSVDFWICPDVFTDAMSLHYSRFGSMLNAKLDWVQHMHEPMKTFGADEVVPYAYYGPDGKMGYATPALLSDMDRKIFGECGFAAFMNCVDADGKVTCESVANKNFVFIKDAAEREQAAQYVKDSVEQMKAKGLTPAFVPPAVEAQTSEMQLIDLSEAGRKNGTGPYLVDSSKYDENYERIVYGYFPKKYVVNDSKSVDDVYRAFFKYPVDYPFDKSAGVESAYDPAYAGTDVVYAYKKRGIIVETGYARPAFPSPLHRKLYEESGIVTSFDCVSSTGEVGHYVNVADKNLPLDIYCIKDDDERKRAVAYLSEVLDKGEDKSVAAQRNARMNGLPECGDDSNEATKSDDIGEEFS